MTSSQKISILGCGIGRLGVALLAKQKKFDVFVSEKQLIKESFKQKFISLDVQFEEGKNSLDKIFPCDVLIKSPGIPLNHEIIIFAKKNNIKILDEIAFAANFTKAKLIGITGSNGKSTVVFMVYEILKDAGFKVEVCGNVDVSFALLIYENRDIDFFILELSSFQLESFGSTHLDLACILNISENHLDHHKNFQNYIDAKLNILNGLRSEDFFIYNADDKNIFFDTSAKKISISNSDLCDFSKKVYNIKGEHNILNSLFATKICSVFKIEEKKILESLNNYKSLPHRIEFVNEFKSISFYNDSKSTTIASTEAALNFFIEKDKNVKIILLLGGVDKGNDYSKLLKFVPYLKKIICIGKNNETILKTFGCDICIEECNMKQIIEKSISFSEKGSVILLSPACASFDFYKNFEERGDKFKKEIFLLNK